MLVFNDVAGDDALDYAGDRVGDVLGDDVGDAVGDAVDDAVGDSLDDEIDAAFDAVDLDCYPEFHLKVLNAGDLADHSNISIAAPAWRVTFSPSPEDDDEGSWWVAVPTDIEGQHGAIRFL